MGNIFELSPYSLNREEKRQLLNEELSKITLHHYENCEEYKKIVDVLKFYPFRENNYEELPFLPVRMFKEYDLLSVPREEIFKTMTSSGTTGQAVSKIYLNREVTSNQQKVLVKIVENFTGAARCPMLIIDCPSVIKDRKMFSARGAGIIGFSIFGTDKTYALTDEMELNVEAVESFLQRHKGERILLFGFTFMVWQYFYREIKKRDLAWDFGDAILIHGGGWKKLTTESVSKEEFKNSLQRVCGIKEVHDYYGMVEQTGTIYMECECGHLHASIFSDIIVRNPKDFSCCKPGERGLIQVVSLLPKSYPGHSLLTEDEGEIIGEDDCPCGRLGKYFKVHGRMKGAEIRGCSDTHEQR
ncbi:MAG: acyl-protein synthetase [Lachnospiraceae bacterium]|nr:acyl-protein synthetase [Lachnospiraceae bacterium]